VQQVWSNIRQRRYPRTWDGQTLPTFGHVIEWQPLELACGRCGRSLGRYVAYHARDEWGIVEDTTRHYQPTQPALSGRGERGPRSNARFWLEGEVGHRASKTSACFHCPACDSDYRRNLARLGRQLFADDQGSTYLLE
jgi:hypothetical protein